MSSINTYPLPCRDADLVIRELLERARSGSGTLIMGILNVTPDSFSDGGKYNSVERAYAHAERMIEDGAEIIDIGGESTRPATFQSGGTISRDEELRRVIPVIEKISQQFPSVPLSIDTYKSDVAREAVAAGAAMINDISAMRADGEMAHTMAASGAAVCLMHLLGLPGRIEPNPGYDDVVLEIREHLQARALAAEHIGIRRESIVLDPGIGFGKTTHQNLELLRRLRELVFADYPLLIGTSRKSTIGAVLGGAASEDRLEGTAATVALAIANGAAIVRVHDVKEMARVARMADAIVRG
jgi:dihydropteroate synthase